MEIKGKVVKKLFGAGSKSEHMAVFRQDVGPART